jgi:phage-related protein
MLNSFALNSESLNAGAADGVSLITFLAALDLQQNNICTSGAVLISNAEFTGLSAEQNNTSSVGAIGIPSVTFLAASNSQQQNTCIAGAILTSNAEFTGLSAEQNNTSSVGVIITTIVASTKPVFIWYPNEEHSNETKPSINTTKYGDGYELRVAKGINTQPETWELEFTRNLTEIASIRAFLKARGGLQSFLWTTPYSEQKTFVAREGWKEKRVGTKIVTITVKFEQVFES